MASIAKKHQLSTDVERFITKMETAMAYSALQASKVVGEQIVHDAQQQLLDDEHVKTGALFDSVHYEVGDVSYGKGDGAQVSLRIVADAMNSQGQYYGGIIEDEDPFIASAIENNLDAFDDEFQAIFQDYMQNS